MLLKKRVFIPVIIAVILVLGVAGGVVAAKNSDNTPPTTANAAPAAIEANPDDTLIGKVAEILGIEEATLREAFNQARNEIREERLDAYLSKLVADNKITQEQADAFKAWLESKPDDTAYRNAVQEWLEANPLAGTELGLPGMGGFPGNGPGPRMGCFNCPNRMATPPE